MNYVWCKVCTKNYDSIIRSPFYKGEIKTAVKTFVDGTNNVTKYKIERHLKSKSHEIALSVEQDRPINERIIIEQPDVTRKIQPTITSYINASAKDSYRKLLRTAYELALTPSMPLKHFEVLVKCQKQNGIKLIQGKQDGRAAKEFIHCISAAIQEKVAVVLAGSDFMSVLSDGSQARKTGREKDLILTRVERGGLPCYFVTSLAEMALFGGTDAQSIKKAIDHSFLTKMDLGVSKYGTRLVSATADGASANMGKYRGALAQLKLERPWLITIHCVNHRIELAVKATMNNPCIKDIEDFYTSNYNLFKKSGAIKAEVSAAAEAIGITYYALPKITGTRFVSHRYRGFSPLLHMLPALKIAYENYVTEQKCGSTKDKLIGLLKKMKDAEIICGIATALDIFEVMRPLSLVFEGEGLMAFNIKPTVDITIGQFQDIFECHGEVLLDSHPRSLTFEYNDTGEIVLVRDYCRAGHEQRSPQNREYIKVRMDDISNFCPDTVQTSLNKISSIAADLSDILSKRFEDFESPLFMAMQWLDPKYWTDSKDYGVEQIEKIYQHFKKPLDDAGFDFIKVGKEWRLLKAFVKSFFIKAAVKNPLSPEKIWQNIVTHRKDEYPNVSLLVSLLTCLSGSNSKVERAFSVLTLLLSDRRHSLHHETMEDLMLIKCNNKNWGCQEREDIIERAFEIYMSKRRIGLTEGQPDMKRGRVEALFEEVSESELSGSVSSIDEDDNHEMDIE